MCTLYISKLVGIYFTIMIMRMKEKHGRSFRTLLVRKRFWTSSVGVKRTFYYYLFNASEKSRYWNSNNRDSNDLLYGSHISVLMYITVDMLWNILQRFPSSFPSNVNWPTNWFATYATFGHVRARELCISRKYKINKTYLNNNKGSLIKVSELWAPWISTQVSYLDSGL